MINKNAFSVLHYFHVGLRVTSGQSYCRVGANNCVTDGAGNYGNREACTVEVLGAGTLTATEFSTESCCDFVEIAIENPANYYSRVRYRGTTGPRNVAVAAGSTMRWHSDYSVVRAGWTICWTAGQCRSS